MKKLIFALLIVCLMLAMVTPVFADNDTGQASSPEFFSWGMLATYAGALAATLVITQLIKGIPYVNKLHPRLVSWMVAAILLLAANYFIDSLTLETAGICIINAGVISLAANGGYDLLKSTKT